MHKCGVLKKCHATLVSHSQATFGENILQSAQVGLIKWVNRLRQMGTDFPPHSTCTTFIAIINGGGTYQSLFYNVITAIKHFYSFITHIHK